MISGKKVVAVIPARGGSKGLPNKNILDLCGKPVLAYTIEAALKSQYLDRVIVSTDSEEIAQVSKTYGAEAPFMRPAELSTDTAHTPPVIEHAVEFVEKENFSVDFVVTLQPTSPLRKTKDIDRGIELIANGEFDSVMSITPADYPPYWIIRKENNRAVPFVDDGIDYFCKERQELPPTFQINGAVYVTKRTVLVNNKVIIAKNCGVFEMSHESSMDIDTQEDLKRIELVLEKRKSEVAV